MAFKKIRNMKIYERAGYRYKSTPMIMFKEQWLNELGFEHGTPICVECSGGKLVIMKVDEIEATFTEIPLCVAKSDLKYGKRECVMCKIIMCGSFKGGGGKSITTFNLAYSLVEIGKKVLCVDFDS